MAKDPAFLFYPGDYLRDTQCLSEKSQVAYDRIMCEHMRNICITQQQLNFFMKRLTEEEKKEVMSLLKKIAGGFQIEWIAESICKRKSYSESRRNNKLGKYKNISQSYDLHMENESEIENTIEVKDFGKSENLLETEISVFTMEAAERNQFTQTGNRNTEFIRQQWEIFLLERKNDPLHKKRENVGRMGEYFLNWVRTKFPKQINGKKIDMKKIEQDLKEHGDEKV